MPEDSEGHWRRSGNSFGLGKPKVAHCHGWLKAEGLASAECHGLSALPQCRKVESMGLFVLQVQPPNPVPIWPRLGSRRSHATLNNGPRPGSRRRFVGNHGAERVVQGPKGLAAPR